jgi:hypothetical protein
VTLIIATALWPWPASAQIDQAITRAQSNNIQRAIENTLAAVIYPKLAIRNPIRAHVASIVASPLRDSLLVLLDDGTARLWDAARGIEERTITLAGDRLQSAAWAPEGNQVLFGTGHGKLMAWNVWSDSWSPLDVAADGPVVQMRVSTNGFYAAVASAQGRLYRVDFRASRKIAAVGDIREALRTLAISADGRQIFALGTSGRLHIWSQDAAAFTDPAPALSVTAVEALWNGGFVTGDTKGAVTMWRPAPGGGYTATPLRAHHDGAVTALLPLPSRLAMVSAGADRTVQMVPLESGPAAKVLRVTMDAVPNCLAADRPGNRLYSCNETGLIDLVDLQSGTRLGQMIETATGWAVVDNVGRFDGSFGGLNDLEYISASTHFSLDHFAQVYYEPGLLADLMNPSRKVSTPNAAPLSAGVTSPPTARIDLQGKPTANQVELDVNAAAARGAIRAIRLERNNRAIDLQDKAVVTVLADTSTTLGTGARRAARYRVSLLPGRNVFTAIAIGDSPIEGQPAQLQVVAPEAAPAPHVLHLLSIGINKYARSELQLQFAVADARAMVDTVRSHLPTDVSSSTIDTLYDTAASSAGINDALARLQSAAADDIVVIYLAGHGTVAQGQWYFLPADLPAVELDPVQRYGLSVDKLQSYLSRIGALRVVMIIDACYSGSAVEQISRSVAHRRLWAVGHSLGVDVLAAAEKDNEAPEFPELGHGALTYTLLQGLNGAAANGAGTDIYVRNLMAYAQTTTPQIAQLEFERTERGRGVGEVSLATSLAQLRLPVPMMVSFGDDFAIARRVH